MLTEKDRRLIRLGFFAVSVVLLLGLGLSLMGCATRCASCRHSGYDGVSQGVSGVLGQ